jgi:uncharacterized lipoprotein YmbA
MNQVGQKNAYSGCASAEENLNYYRRRAAEELAAADGASSAVVAAVHKSLAERYSALAGEPQPFGELKPGYLRES